MYPFKFPAFQSIAEFLLGWSRLIQPHIKISARINFHLQQWNRAGMKTTDIPRQGGLHCVWSFSLCPLFILCCIYHMLGSPPWNNAMDAGQRRQIRVDIKKILGRAWIPNTSIVRSTVNATCFAADGGLFLYKANNFYNALQQNSEVRLVSETDLIRHRHTQARLEWYSPETENTWNSAAKLHLPPD